MTNIEFKYIDTHAKMTRWLWDKRVEKSIWPSLIGIDIETTSLEPWDGEISTIQISDGETTTILDVLQIGLNALDCLWFKELLEDARILKIAHNARFEMKWFMYHLGAEPESFFDTRLASQIIAAGDAYARHDLETVANVFADVQLDKGEQTSDWSVRPLSDSQLTYAAWDAVAVIPVYHEQVRRLEADDLTRVAAIEFDAIRPIVRAEINGLHLDADRWNELLVKKKAELARLHDELLEMLSEGVDWTERNPAKVGTRPKKLVKPVNPLRSKAYRGSVISDATRASLQESYERAMKQYEFDLHRWQSDFDYWESLPDEIPATLNPNSVQQITKVIYNVTGLRLGSTNEKFLLPFVDKYPAIAKLVEYRGAAKGVSSYGDNFLKFSERDGRVHTTFRQILDTGRMSSKEPNVQQVPHDEAHRRCFTAPPGRKLIIADYSQIQLRILAEFSRDVNFVGDFNSGVDLHTKGASRFMRIAVADVTKQLRGEAKQTNFGVVFGIQGEALGRKLGIPTSHADRLIREYFKAYPGNDLWLQKADKQARVNLFARTMAGRLQRFSHDGSRGQLSAVGRNGMNMPIQGSEADMLKRALYFLDLQIRGTDVLLVNIVHDELVLEAPENKAEWAAEVLVDSMVRAGREFITVVDVPADAVIADEWVKE